MAPGYLRTALNLILFAAINAYLFQLETPAAWVGCACSWAMGTLFVGYMVERNKRNNS